MSGRTHYHVLQVLPTADQKVIEAAYKALIRQYHPDVAPGNTNLSVRINEAYAVLSDPHRRADYDAGLETKASKMLGGRYRVISKIASGGFGTTYKAEHIELPGSLVCVKHAGRISPQYEEILTKEARQHNRYGLHDQRMKYYLEYMLDAHRILGIHFGEYPVADDMQGYERGHHHHGGS